MNRDINDPRQCEAIQDELTELALGTLFGRSRSEVLDHVGLCPRCAATLEQLSIVADTLLQLAPEIEPPLGFELRLAERLQASAKVNRPRRFRRASAISAVALILVVLSFGLGTLLSTKSDNNQGQLARINLATANLTSNGKVLGEAMISEGAPGWIFVTIDGRAWSGTVTCDVTLAGGTIERIGVFKLSGGYGAWGAPLTAPAGNVRSAQLITPNGTVLASAQFPV